MAASEDFRFPATDGRRPRLPTRLLHGYLRQVLERAAHEPRGTRPFAEVVNLLAPPLPAAPAGRPRTWDS